MSVVVHCPNCKKAFSVGDQSIGSRARCSGCGNVFTLSMSMDDTGKSKVAGEQAAHGSAAKQSALGKSAAGKAKGRSERERMPKTFGEYVIERKLGAGAMGVVYLARDPILDRKVAIKVLPASLSRDEERLKRFLREAKSAARLHHTNVATVHQAGAEGRLAYIAMEYVEGKSLDKAATATKPMDWREATHVIRDAAAGLGAAHAIGLVHRDVKPANLIRTTDGVTKVVDFGLARGQQMNTQFSQQGMASSSSRAPSPCCDQQTNTELTQQGTLLGTPAYMSPEQWSGGRVDGRSDLYSLTCTYYFLLTGRPPFDAPSLPALGYQHRYEPFPDPREVVPELPDDVCRILIRGSAKERSSRFQAADELISELDMILECQADFWEDALAPPSPMEEPDEPVVRRSDDEILGEYTKAAEWTSTPSSPSPASQWLQIAGIALVLSLLVGVVGWFVLAGINERRETIRAETAKQEAFERLSVVVDTLIGLRNNSIMRNDSDWDRTPDIDFDEWIRDGAARFAEDLPYVPEYLERVQDADSQGWVCELIENLPADSNLDPLRDIPRESFAYEAAQGRLAPRSAEVEDTSFTETETTANWWIYGLALDRMGGGTGDVYATSIGIASPDENLIEGLSKESWELKPGPNCDIEPFIVMFQGDADWSPEDIGVPNRMMKVVGGSKTRRIGDFDFSIRLKGDSEWVRPFDFLQVNDADDTFRTIPCPKCPALIRIGSQKCDRCGAKSP